MRPPFTCAPTSHLISLHSPTTCLHSLNLQLRGTLRFLLGNLAGFDPATHAVPYDQLPALDRFMLSRLAGLQQEVRGIGGKTGMVD